MARQVYFDPFGQRVEGYRAGVQDEQSLQGATRAARNIDYDYYNMAPLRLDKARRDNAYEAYLDEFNRKNARRLDYGADLESAQGYGLRTGNYNPMQFADAEYYGAKPNTGPLPAFDPNFVGTTNPQAYAEYAKVHDPATNAAMQFNASNQLAYDELAARQQQARDYYAFGLEQMRLSNGGGGAGGGWNTGFGYEGWNTGFNGAGTYAFDANGMPTVGNINDSFGLGPLAPQGYAPQVPAPAPQDTAAFGVPSTGYAAPTMPGHYNPLNVNNSTNVDWSGMFRMPNFGISDWWNSYIRSMIPNPYSRAYVPPVEQEPPQ